MNNHAKNRKKILVKLLKNQLAFLIITVLLGCAGSKPDGFWISDNAKTIHEIKKHKAKDIRMKLLPESNFSIYKLAANDTLNFKWIEVNMPQNYIIQEEKNVMFFNFGVQNYHAYRLKNPNKDDILNQAIAWDVEKRYPVMIENWSSGRINNNSWSFEKCKIELSKTGILTIRGTQRTNRCEGFTGRVLAELRDKNNNVLLVAAFKAQGIDPKWGCNENTIGYNDQLSLKDFSMNGIELTADDFRNLIIGTTHITLTGERAGKGTARIIKITDDVKKVSDNLKKIGADVVKIAGYLGLGN